MTDKSSHVPKTSTTLLLQLGGDANHVRWTEFVARYRPMMERYLTRNFPDLEHDDIIQETVIAIVKVLPDYRYAPEETGHFHNYLTGILRHKALRLLERQTQQTQHLADATPDMPRPDTDVRQEEDWKQTVFEIALGQLLNDESIAPRTRAGNIGTAWRNPRPHASHPPEKRRVPDRHRSRTARG